MFLIHQMIHLILKCSADMMMVVVVVVVVVVKIMMMLPHRPFTSAQLDVHHPFADCQVVWHVMPSGNTIVCSAMHEEGLRHVTGQALGTTSSCANRWAAKMSEGSQLEPTSTQPYLFTSPRRKSERLVPFSRMNSALVWGYLWARDEKHQCIGVLGSESRPQNVRPGNAFLRFLGGIGVSSGSVGEYICKPTGALHVRCGRGQGGQGFCRPTQPPAHPKSYPTPCTNGRRWGKGRRDRGPMLRQSRASAQLTGMWCLRGWGSLGDYLHHAHMVRTCWAISLSAAVKLPHRAPTTCLHRVYCCPIALTLARNHTRPGGLH